MQPCSVTIVQEPLGTYCRYAPLAVIGHWLQQTHFLAPLWAPVEW